MAKINLLAKRSVDTLPPGFHSDGGNLYLRVKDTGACSWVFRLRFSIHRGPLQLLRNQRPGAPIGTLTPRRFTHNRWSRQQILRR